MVVGCASSVQWVGKPSQFDDLGNGSNGCLNAAHFDLLSTSKSSLPDPFGETLKDKDSF